MNETHEEDCAGSVDRRAGQRKRYLDDPDGLSVAEKLRNQREGLGEVERFSRAPAKASRDTVYASFVFRRAGKNRNR